MAKELLIPNDVVEYDLPNIIEYHLPKSFSQAVAIVEEYDRAIALLRETPRIYRLRPYGWRAYLFRTGPYALYYREMPTYWLVAAILHTRRDPDWINHQLLMRRSTITRNPSL